MKYIVTIELFSSYDNSNENIIVKQKEEYISEDINTLLKRLNDEEEVNEDWDDSSVINFKAKSDLIETSRNYIKIVDMNGIVVFRK